MNYAIFPAPPYMIYSEEDDDSQIHGIDIDIVKEIANQMNLEVKFLRCPWARCLERMEAGIVDILSSAFKKPEREVFMNYFQQPYLEKLPIAFYLKKGKGTIIKNYQDIYALREIGVLRGASYFEQFDTDTKINKYAVTSQKQLLLMLLADRLEAITGYVHTINYRVVAEGFTGKIEKSLFEYNGVSEVYMAISKNSPFAERVDEFNRINDELLRNGVIYGIIKSYYDKYTPVGE
ncbi:substrate-binding periplasmic protein [Desulfamplus magnetovallimortis]|uniref:substrate-binding periplasmic protein n=1 Tax=Desulfamplus magnetovallimortis TaxID=1246637 RepID=UPI001646710A|nr:transporter substrate-binding domain-containing protein [Desulfamplus magnetovallimortis]